MSRPWRIDPGLVLVVGLACGAFASVAAVATLAVAFAVLLFWRVQLAWRERCCFVLALLLGWGRASRALREFEARQAQARELVAALEPCAVRGRVVGSPVVLQGVAAFDAELAEIDCGGRIERRPVRARLSGAFPSWGRGDEFSAIAKLSPVSGFRNFSLPDPLPGLARHAAVLRGRLLWYERERVAGGLLAGIDRARARVRERIDATYAGPARALGRALVLGESDLDPADEAAFRKSGLSHLLAVSGTHLVFAVLGVLRALEALLRRWEWLAVRWDVRRAAALPGLLLAPLYADFAGGSGSAWRASFMLLGVLGARVLGRHAPSSRVVAGSLLLGWLGDGLVVFDPSFVLSLSATLGLLLAGRGLLEQRAARAAELVEPRRWELPRLFQRVSASAVVSIAASVPCIPVLLWLGPGVSVAGVAANLLAGPLGEMLALPLCLTHAIAAPVPDLERGLALVASGTLLAVREIARLTASVEWLFVELPPPGRWHVASLAIGAAAWLGVRAEAWLGARSLHARGPARALAAVALGLAGLLAAEAGVIWDHSAARWRELRRLRVTALDVGQGDAALVDLPDGRLMLIDAGGLPGSSVDLGERVLVPILRARRRSHLDIVVLSHPHPDHFGGLFTLARAVSIGEFWHAASEPGPDIALLLRELEAQGARLRSARELCLDPPTVLGGASIELLAPCPDVAPEQSVNDNSLVVRIRLGAQSALFVGDAERWAEEQLLERHGQELRADFLKVGHHGSRSSSSRAFVARVLPRVAVISCGVGNRFGHPHAEALAELAGVGALVLRIDQTGSVEWQADAAQAGVRSVQPPSPEARWSLGPERARAIANYLSDAWRATSPARHVPEQRAQSVSPP